MSWNNTPGGGNGGSPWGNGDGGGKNPWGGRSGGGNGPQPPDLDEILRRAQESLSGYFPGGVGPGKLIALGSLTLLVLWLASGFYIIQPGVYGVIKRFGAWNRTETSEGLGYHLPWPIESVEQVNVTEIRRMTIGFQEHRSFGTSAEKQGIPEESHMLTSDANIVDLHMIVLWNIRSAEDFLFNIEDQEGTIKKVAESAIREVVGQTRMFPIITQERDAVAQKAREIMAENLDAYHSGVHITQVLIQKAEVHPDVQDAFQDVQSAKQDAENASNLAQAYRQDVIPKAEGQAIEMIQKAQGYKESAIAKATGEAARFESIYKAYTSSKDVTRQRLYIESMEKILRENPKIILDSEASRGVLPYLPLKGGQ